MKNRLTILSLLVIILIFTNSIVFSQNTVTKVNDGDTFQIDTGEKVRLLGIDTPEKWESCNLIKTVKDLVKIKK